MKGVLTVLGRFREAATPGDDGVARVLLMTPGGGNVADGNFYAPEVIAQAPQVFEGARCFLDHPARSDEEDRPERSVKEQAGWFSNVAAVPDGGLQADFVAGGEGAAAARRTIESALRYQAQYPDKVWAGFSVNADGDWHVEPADQLIQRYPQFRERLEKRDTWNVVDRFTSAMSVDLVTFPARGGKALSMLEAESTLSSRSWRDRFRGASRETLCMLRQRTAAAKASPDALADVLHGVKRLRTGLRTIESSPEVVADLQAKADRVADTHDPAVIADLLTALRAFLDEELREPPEDEDTHRQGGTAMDIGNTTTDIGNTTTAPPETAPPLTDEELEKRRVAAEADGFMRYAEKAATTMTCEACGHQQEARRMEAAEEGGGRRAEVARPQESHAPPTGGLLEVERRELAELRIEKRRRELNARAEKAIREAGVEGLIPVAELAAFEEAQWPALIRVAQQGAPTRSVGAGLIGMPAGASPRRNADPVAVFESHFDR